jgi:hypothetical protein
MGNDSRPAELAVFDVKQFIDVDHYTRAGDWAAWPDWRKKRAKEPLLLVANAGRYDAPRQLTNDNEPMTTYSGGIAMAKKTICAIGRAEFRSKAKPVSVTINGVPLQAEVKEFSTGSLGWYLNGKTSIEIDGKLVPVQIGLNLTIVGSKELPQDEHHAAAAVA